MSKRSPASAAQPFRCRVTSCPSPLIPTPRNLRPHRPLVGEKRRPKTSDNESSQAKTKQRPDEEARSQRDGLCRFALRLFQFFPRPFAEISSRHVDADRRSPEK